MKPGRSTGLDELRRRVAATDAAVIDELYGLEPVYEPGGPARAAGDATEFVPVDCPYCWERFESQVDLSGGSCTYVEDCQVCCQPIEFTCEIEDGQLRGFRPERMD